MALQIVQDECTACGDCMPVCPMGAVLKKGGSYIIDADACTECEGEFDFPQCEDVCEVDGCILPA